MSKIVNLRTVRKQKDRAEKRHKATIASEKHGESRVIRDSRKAERERSTRHLDGHERDGR